MVLAMTAEARATADKKRLDKIRDTLAQAYGLQLTLQTEDWRDEAGRETPAMQDKRVQAEDRQKAQALLEADPPHKKSSKHSARNGSPNHWNWRQTGHKQI